MNPLLVICGPTATGKTAVALHLAKVFDGELVSADSRQIYKGMDIGTGKDLSKNEKSHLESYKVPFKDKTYTVPGYTTEGIPLWMYDVVDPDEEFSVAHYQALAGAVIGDIHKRGKLPIVVGGTGLYIQALLYPLTTSHIPINPVLRETLKSMDVQHLQKKLQEIDPMAHQGLNQSDLYNPRRLIRKIEIALWRDRKTGRQKDDKIQDETKRQKDTGVKIIGLTAPFDELYRRIDARVDKRVQEGIFREIQLLLAKGYTWDLPSMNTFGYKEWKGEKKKQEIIQQWKWDEHAYARRQMTWFRKQPDITWVDIRDSLLYQSIEQIVGIWYTKNCYAQKD